MGYEFQRSVGFRSWRRYRPGLADESGARKLARANESDESRGTGVSNTVRHPAKRQEPLRPGARTSVRSDRAATGIVAFVPAHTHQTPLDDSGASLKTSQLLGHSELETTLNVYTHTVSDSQRNAVERVSGFWTQLDSTPTGDDAGRTAKLKEVEVVRV